MRLVECVLVLVEVFILIVWGSRSSARCSSAVFVIGVLNDSFFFFMIFFMMFFMIVQKYLAKISFWPHAHIAKVADPA